MSGKRNCWDNACAESFFKPLKGELETLDGTHSAVEVRQPVFMYVEAYYNRLRLHECNFFFGANRGPYDILPVSQGRGYLWTHKKKTSLYEEAIEEMARSIREKAAEFRAAHAERKLTINSIERRWGESRVISDDMLKRRYSELANTNEEKELYRKKISAR